MTTRTPNSQLPTSNFQLPTPNSLFSTRHSPPPPDPEQEMQENITWFELVILTLCIGLLTAGCAVADGLSWLFPRR